MLGKGLLGTDGDLHLVRPTTEAHDPPGWGPQGLLVLSRRTWHPGWVLGLPADFPLPPTPLCRHPGWPATAHPASPHCDSPATGPARPSAPQTPPATTPRWEAGAAPKARPPSPAPSHGTA